MSCLRSEMALPLTLAGADLTESREIAGVRKSQP